MVTLLEQQATEFLTIRLGRTPTIEEIRLAMNAPWTLSNIHNTGNIVQSTLSITDQDNIQDAIDKIEASGGGVVFLNVGTYFPDYNVQIPSDVYLVGASREACVIDFQNQAFQINSLGTLGNETNNILVSNLTIQNSSISGLKLQYANNSELDGIDVFGCDIGIEMDNVFGLGLIGMGAYLEGNGINMSISNSSSFSIYFTAMDSSTSGANLVLSNSSGASIFDSGYTNGFTNGISITDCNNIAFISLSVDDNGAHGIELISGNSNLQFSGVNVSGNTGDGYKLTATSDKISLTAFTSLNNGGWGVNIANANCDNNIIIGCQTSGNSSGGLTDSGTGTLKSTAVNIFS